MPRHACLLSVACIALVASAAGCTKAPPPGKQRGSRPPRQGADETSMQERGDTQSAARALPHAPTQSPTQATTEGQSSKRSSRTDHDPDQRTVSATRGLLIGTWVTHFVVEDKAFQAFVEANMLTEELAQSERQRWSNSTISIVFHADGSFTWTEPDGNQLAGTWGVSTVSGGRASVDIASEGQQTELLLELDESGDGFTAEFSDDRYELLPLMRPYQFSRD